jgi:hypothetical protein
VAASVSAPGRHAGNTSNFRLLYISAGEEFRDDAWEMDPRNWRFGWEAALSPCS